MFDIENSIDEMTIFEDRVSTTSPLDAIEYAYDEIVALDMPYEIHEIHITKCNQDDPASFFDVKIVTKYVGSENFLPCS